MSNATPFFSIIVPVYNTVKELRRCTDSVLCQTCRDFELILVDDGSRDGSGELCDEIAAGDDRVVCIHKENGGCSEARNTGIRAARGTYLLFVDSDDMWDNETALQHLDDLIRLSFPDLVCFGTAIYSEDGRLEKERRPVLPDNCPKTKEAVLRHLVYTNQYFSAVYVKTIKRDVALENDLFFRKELRSGEDIEWSAKAMIACHSMDVLPEAFYKRVRRSDGSITSSIGTKNVLDVLSAIESGMDALASAADNSLRDLYFEYWTYQYAMLLGLAEVTKKEPDFPEILSRLKKLKWLLKYDHVKKVKAVHWLTALTGIRKSMWILSKYYKVKS